MAYLPGLVLFLFELYWFSEWWGMGGVIASVAIPPLAALFPFIYLVKEGFSLLYFGLWGVCLLGLMLVASSDEG